MLLEGLSALNDSMILSRDLQEMHFLEMGSV